MNDISIATIVVTFNRKELLLKNINAQLDQTYKANYYIIIDNNSTDGTREYLKLNSVFENENVIYHKLDENLGGAGGFEAGVQFALTSTCADYFILMDDDGRPANRNTFAELLKKLPNNKYVFLNSLVLCDDKSLSFGLMNNHINTKELALKNSEVGLIFGHTNPFNGTLVSRDLVEKIGLPNGNLFLRGDEHDYQTRAENSGAFVATAVNSLYYHPSPVKTVMKRILFTSFNTTYEAPWKEYYQMRNYTYLRKKFGMSSYHVWFVYAKRLVGVYLFRAENKRSLRRFIMKGYKDGINAKLGKTVEPGQKDS